jgi:hypothetical protein
MIRLLRKAMRLGLLGGLGYGLYKTWRGRRDANTWSDSWVSTGPPGATVPAAAPMPPPPAPVETAPPGGPGLSPENIVAASPPPPAPAPGSVAGPTNGEAVPAPAVSEEPADSNGQGEPGSARPAPARGAKPSKRGPARRTPTGKAEEPPGERRWVAANDGVCPQTHPVKAKLSSKIFHSPGSRNYSRTHADRCYPDEQSASADGLRPAQR